MAVASLPPPPNQPSSRSRGTTASREASAAGEALTCVSKVECVVRWHAVVSRLRDERRLNALANKCGYAA